MHWDDLQYFLAVARSGQLARAASTLDVDATTVGRRLRRLEQTVEQALFEQTREGQTLTEAGERLLLEAEAMERTASRIEAPAGGARRLSGLIRVSVSEGFGTWFVAHHLKSFLQANPDVAVDLVANSGFLSPSKRETDVAILLARPHKGHLVSKKLSDYCLRIYAARSYLEQHGQINDRSALSAHPLIGYIPDFIYAPELRYMDEIAPGLRLQIRSSSINAQYRLTASGAGVAVLPCFIGDADPDLVRVVPDISITRTFWLVTHEDTRRLSRIQAFVEWMTALVQQKRDRLTGRSAT